jgi:hypothetical protein
MWLVAKRRFRISLAPYGRGKSAEGAKGEGLTRHPSPHRKEGEPEPLSPRERDRVREPGRLPLPNSKFFGLQPKHVHKMQVAR